MSSGKTLAIGLTLMVGPFFLSIILPRWVKIAFWVLNLLNQEICFVGFGKHLAKVYLCRKLIFMVKNIKHIVLSLLLVVLPIGYCTAANNYDDNNSNGSGGDGVEPNPVLAGTITYYKIQTVNALEALRNAQLIRSEGHVFVGREVQAVNALQREFNEYLDHFHNSVAMAADLYGIYFEIKKTIKLAGQVTSILDSAPTNAIAVLLTPSYSGIYGSVINTSLSAGQDIYNACLSKQKRTEQDRNKQLDIARKKIRKVNSDLTKLIIVLKYTSLEDIWYSIRQRAKYMDKDNKNTIIERCYENWKNNIK